jgi:hypothetical protein
LRRRTDDWMMYDAAPRRADGPMKRMWATVT